MPIFQIKTKAIHAHTHIEVIYRIFLSSSHHNKKPSNTKKQLFSQLLTGFNGSNDIDIDTLTTMLEENRDLLNDMTSREHCKEGAAQIPKLMLDLFAQANNNLTKTAEENDEIVDNVTGCAEGTSNETTTVSSAQEISNNLPKVWKVLIELLNHQQLKPVQNVVSVTVQRLCLFVIVFLFKNKTILLLRIGLN